MLAALTLLVPVGLLGDRLRLMAPVPQDRHPRTADLLVQVDPLLVDLPKVRLP